MSRPSPRRATTARSRSSWTSSPSPIRRTMPATTSSAPPGLVERHDVELRDRRRREPVGSIGVNWNGPTTGRGGRLLGCARSAWPGRVYESAGSWSPIGRCRNGVERLRFVRTSRIPLLEARRGEGRLHAGGSRAQATSTRGSSAVSTSSCTRCAASSVVAASTHCGPPQLRSSGKS